MSLHHDKGFKKWTITPCDYVQVVCKCYATVMNLHPAVSMINVFALSKESSNYSHPLQLWAAVTVTPYSTAFLLYSSFCRGEVRPYSIISNVSCNDPLFL